MFCLELRKPSDVVNKMKGTNYFATLLLTSLYALIATANLDLAHEHAGNLFQKFHWYRDCGSSVLHDGNSTGMTGVYGGESLYIAQPRGGQQDHAILYLTDIFGNALLNNRLLADSLARAGYLVVMPDLFRGDPVPTTAMGGSVSGFNMTAWRAQHPQSQIEEVIESTIATMRDQLNVSKIGAVGYCFGGRYVARFLAPGRGLDAGFTAHPSSTMAGEWEAIAGPISIAFGDLDGSSTPENRTNIEAIFKSENKTYQTVLYANAEHGFAVRTNLTDKKKAFAQESAYLQAVRWFDTWIKDED